MYPRISLAPRKPPAVPAILQRTVCIIMSTDKENHKSEDMKVVEEKGDSKPDSNKVESNDKVEKDAKNEKEDKSSDESERDKVKKESPKKSGSKTKETKEEKHEDEEEDDEDNDDKGDDDEDDEESDKKLDKDGKDQPLQVSGARERKKVERFTVDKSEIKEISAVEIPEGKGVSLGNIGVIENNISKHRGDDLKKFHQVLFGRPGKATLIKKNIRRFNGFDFDKDTEQYERKKSSLAKLEVKYLKDMASILDLTKGGSREELASRLLDFLMEPKGAGEAAPVVSKGGLTKGGRPKRSAAAKANNKGYSESDDEAERASRSRRSKGKRPNLKDESSSEDEKPKIEEDDDKDEKGSDEDMLVEDETPSSDESDDPKSKKKRAPPPKVSKKPKKKATPAKKEKPAPKKRKPDSEEEEEDSSEDDQPLVKKAKAPPTDDEIKTFVKEILEGANLEEITMKTVCKQVYSHYPEFDLAHKKDFIKTTVKSLIST